MLESFNENARTIYNTHQDVARELREQYNNIYQILKKQLDTKQIVFIPVISDRAIFTHDDDREIVLELISASGIAISYLRSLEGDLDKELVKREQELKRKEEEIESLRNILKGGVEALKEVPELLRSEAVANMKKKHREIEKYTKKNVQEK